MINAPSLAYRHARNGVLRNGKRYGKHYGKHYRKRDENCDGIMTGCKIGFGYMIWYRVN